MVLIDILVHFVRARVQFKVFPGAHVLVLVRVVFRQYEGENSRVEPDEDR